KEEYSALTDSFMSILDAAYNYAPDVMCSYDAIKENIVKMAENVFERSHSDTGVEALKQELIHMIAQKGSAGTQQYDYGQVYGRRMRARPVRQSQESNAAKALALFIEEEAKGEVLQYDASRHRNMRESHWPENQVQKSSVKRLLCDVAPKFHHAAKQLLNIN